MTNVVKTKYQVENAAVCRREFNKISENSNKDFLIPKPQQNFEYRKLSLWRGRLTQKYTIHNILNFTLAFTGFAKTPIREVNKGRILFVKDKSVF